MGRRSLAVSIAASKKGWRSRKNALKSRPAPADTRDVPEIPCPHCGRSMEDLVDGDPFLHHGPVAWCHSCEAGIYEYPQPEEEEEETV